VGGPENVVALGKDVPMSHVSDFVVIAILRTNSSLIKEICAQTLFNLLHHEKTREEMVETGVLWALMKLSKLDSRETQNICAKVLFNFSCYEDMQQRIMEHGVPRLLAIATTHDAEVEDPRTKQYCAGALCNLAFRPEAGGLYAKGGAIGFLKELMDVENDDNEMYCSTILYNLSHCEIEARLMLVHEGAVPLLINLSRSAKQRTIIACLSSCYNLTLNSDARKDMVRDLIVSPIISCVEHTDDLELLELGITSLYHLSVGKTGHDSESCVHMVQNDEITTFLVQHAANYTERSAKIGRVRASEASAKEVRELAKRAQRKCSRASEASAKEVLEGERSERKGGGGTPLVHLGAKIWCSRGAPLVHRRRRASTSGAKKYGARGAPLVHRGACRRRNRTSTRRRTGIRYCFRS
jgi:hypothetical protein